MLVAINCLSYAMKKLYNFFSMKHLKIYWCRVFSLIAQDCDKLIANFPLIGKLQACIT